MIEYIKEYGIKLKSFEELISSINPIIYEQLVLNETKVREVLKYYNSLGIYDDIVKIIINRPDLIFINLDSLKSVLDNIDRKSLINIVSYSIDELILLGI